jgi:hypothetical protein
MNNRISGLSTKAQEGGDFPFFFLNIYFYNDICASIYK